MIKGSINIQQEPEEDEGDYEYYSHYNYNSRNMNHISKQIEDEITKAINKKLFIGTKVRRSIGNQLEFGIVRYFVRDKSRCYNKITGRVEVIEVEWSNNFKALYTPDQLEKVEEQ